MSAEQTPDIETAVWNVCDQIIADHPMWIGDDGRPLDYMPEREARIADFVRELADASAQALAPVLAAAVREARRSWEAHVLERCLETMPAKGEAPDFLLTISTAMLATRADRVAEPQHEAATTEEGA